MEQEDIDLVIEEGAPKEGVNDGSDDVGDFVSRNSETIGGSSINTVSGAPSSGSGGSTGSACSGGSSGPAQASKQSSE